ncbi:hypothetical protein FB45DRAFT_1017301 [Roridomyces roridus]|uniref:DUF6533 domain-containing protein n=1 Tax=Roridomyces roridus TaxID=1738132 RepID=A0AAD7CI56_9AGAR|nr:hypothetical protein FB45DRAFT_1017301 [Roridomyces roridus]
MAEPPIPIPLTPALVKELLQLIGDSQTTNYMAAAGMTLLVFEYLVNFPEEVKHVWQSRRISLWSVLYIWIRYIPLVLFIIDLSFMFREIKSDGVFVPTIPSQMASCTVNSVIVDCILFLRQVCPKLPSSTSSQIGYRVWILYAKSQVFLFLFIPVMIIQTAAMLTIGTLTIAPLKEYIHVGPILKGCYSFTVPRIFTFYVVPFLATSTTMFLMTLYKCLQQLFAVRFTRMPVVTLFLRDGVFLFLTILIYGAVEMAVWGTMRPTLSQVPILPATALHSVVGARILLNIKNLVGTEGQGSISISVGTMTTTGNGTQAHQTVDLGAGCRGI